MDTDGQNPVADEVPADLNAATDHLLSLMGDEEADPQDPDKSEDPEVTDEDPSGSDPDDAGEENEADADDPEQSGEEPKFKVKIDGQELEVNLSELTAGYQRQADYTRKAQALKSDRDAFDAERKAKADEYAQEVGRLAQFAQVVMATDPLLAEAQKIDWANLAEKDPIAYTQKKAALEARLASWEAVMQEHQRVVQDRAKELRAKEEAALREAIPDFADEAKAKTLRGDMRAYLATHKFSEQEIAGIGDHRIVLVVQDAMNYRKLLAAQKAAKEKKVDPAPRTVKSNSADRNDKGAKKLDAKTKRRIANLSISSQADILTSLL